jgi:hypothetical protein
MATAVPVEMPSGKQAQVDSGHLGYLETSVNNVECRLHDQARLQPTDVGLRASASRVGHARKE